MAFGLFAAFVVIYKPISEAIMETEYRAQQKSLSMSECERMCGMWSRDIEQLADRSGWRGLPGQPIKVEVGVALNMLIYSTGMAFGAEPQTLVSYLPGLRIEALLKLGENIDNWSFDGSSQGHHNFLPTLYGSPEVVRPRIARILGCAGNETIRQIRYHSQNDVECLSNEQFGLGDYSRTPRFSIDAHVIAKKLRNACNGTLFIATERERA